MFLELMGYWVQFFGNLGRMRAEISSEASTSDIVELVKQDLVIESKNRDKVRESGKYRQSFGREEYVLSYADLKRFMELWELDKSKNIEYEILQLKRHFKTRNPFYHVCLKETKSCAHSPNQGRSNSRSRSNIRVEFDDTPHQRWREPASLAEAGSSFNKKSYMSAKKSRSRNEIDFSADGYKSGKGY
jgi:hypothetical protein